MHREQTLKQIPSRSGIAAHFWHVFSCLSWFVGTVEQFELHCARQIHFLCPNICKYFIKFSPNSESNSYDTGSRLWRFKIVGIDRSWDCDCDFFGQVLRNVRPKNNREQTKSLTSRFYLVHGFIGNDLFQRIWWIWTCVKALHLIFSLSSWINFFVLHIIVKTDIC